METQKRIRIWKDSDPMNPWKDEDCEPPLMYDGGRDSNGDFSNGEIVDAILAKATYNRIIRHQKKLAEILEIDFQHFKYWNSTASEKVDKIESEIEDASLDQLSELCDLFKIPNTVHSSTGYSQGDWAKVLIVLTDEWFERVGANKKHAEKILQSTAELFDNWAWGDVYGFTIEELKVYKKVLAEEFDNGNFENVEVVEEWEEVDSCGGFFGNKWMKNGMHNYVPEELHHLLENYDYRNIEH